MKILVTDSVKIYKKIQSRFGYFNNFYLVARGCIQQCSSFHWQASFLQFLSHKYFRQLSLVTVHFFCFGFSSLPQKSFPRNVLFAVRKWFLDSLATFFFIFLFGWHSTDNLKYIFVFLPSLVISKRCGGY